MKIPKNCVKTFKHKFSSYPSIIEIHNKSIVLGFLKGLKDEQLIWTHTIRDVDGNQTFQHRLFEYDSTGILVYVIGDSGIFILTKSDKRQIIDYVISRIK